GANSSGAKSDGKTAKEQQIPQDLFGTISVFESWRNAENSASEENIRQTAAPFHKVGKKAEEIQQHLAELASEYLQLHGNAVSLKAEVMKEAEHVEMARRTKDTPMALQGENKAPEMYFINLVRSFESDMIYCRNKIDEVAVCMQAANNPCETPE
ncbi:Nucleoporin p58/p45, partial [Halocaridina rubra]